jgi:hypothetical protein
MPSRDTPILDSQAAAAKPASIPLQLILDSRRHDIQLPSDRIDERVTFLRDKTVSSRPNR